MQLELLDDLYVFELKNLLSAEHQLLNAIPTMAKAAFHSQLAKAFTDRLMRTQTYVERLEQVFQRRNASGDGQLCKAMEGLLEGVRELIAADANPKVRDAALIVAAQRVEHYEKVGYGCVCAYATLMGYNQDAQLLQQTLDEVRAANEKLIHLAVKKINIEAVTPVPDH